jgi:hypothetical protein
MGIIAIWFSAILLKFTCLMLVEAGIPESTMREKGTLNYIKIRKK